MSKLFVLFVIYLLVEISTASTTNDDHRNQVIQFDYYVLALTWPKSFCIIQNDMKAAKQCIDAPQVPDRFTIHGLWPTNKTNIAYSSCPATPKFNFNTMDAEVQRRANDNWLDISKSKGGITEPNDSKSFWSYEWQKHGTCSNLDQDSYMNLTLNTYDKLSLKINMAMKSSSKGGVLDISNFRTELSSSLKIQPKIVCAKLLGKPNDQYLSEIRFDVGKNLPYNFQSNRITKCVLSKPIRIF